jgi:hypothetical protein
MRALKYSAIIISMMIMASGCSFFTPPKQQPVEKDYVGPFWGNRTTHVFSMTPERRTIIVMPRGEGKMPRFCAEPPPDVAESIADSLRVLAEAQLKDPEITAKAEFYKMYTTSAMSLFYRSQGVQLFRDGLFNLCQAYINEALPQKSDYIEIYKELLNKSVSLVQNEIPSVEQNKLSQVMERATVAERDAKAASMEAKNSMEAAEKARSEIKELIDKAKK